MTEFQNATLHFYGPNKSFIISDEFSAENLSFRGLNKEDGKKGKERKSPKRSSVPN